MKMVTMNAFVVSSLLLFLSHLFYHFLELSVVFKKFFIPFFCDDVLCIPSSSLGLHAHIRIRIHSHTYSYILYNNAKDIITHNIPT